MVSAIKFRKCFSKFMIPIALLEKFGCLTFFSRVEVRNMIADSCKPNKLLNTNYKKHGEERHHPKTKKKNQKQKIIAFIINFRMNK